jgi:hypothetical protein
MTKRVWLFLAITLWLGGIGAGLWKLWAYDNRPGVSAHAPDRWPEGTSLSRSSDGPTLLFVAHPQCTCTAASLQELAEILARAPHRPKTYVLFLKPVAVDDGWEQTDLWRTARAIEGVTALRDDDGVEAKRFDVATSGQTFLYDKSGTLIFSGGITGSRAHAGENAGELALISLLTNGQANQRASSVFGCPLFATAE